MSLRVSISAPWMAEEQSECNDGLGQKWIVIVLKMKMAVIGR